MRQYEYRIEKFVLDEKSDRESQITNALNAFASEGWRVVSLDVDSAPKSSRKAMQVLLERRSKKGEAGSRLAKKSEQKLKKSEPGQTKASPKRSKPGAKRT